MATQIAPGVVVLDTRVANGKVGVVAGDDIALTVDTGIDDAEGIAALGAATSMGRETVQLTYTHGHVDHAFGGTAFVGREIISRPEIATHMRSQLEKWAERSGEETDVLEARVGWPTSLVEANAELELGNRRVTLLDTPGHAPASLCLYEPASGLLFGGDTVVTAIPPVFVDGASDVLVRTLRRLAMLGVQVLVPGHGEVLFGKAPIADAISWAADYIERCQEHVDSHSTEDPERIVATAEYETFIGGRLQRDRHGMDRRHQNTIRQLLVERRGSSGN